MHRMNISYNILPIIQSNDWISAKRKPIFVRKSIKFIDFKQIRNNRIASMMDRQKLQRMKRINEIRYLINFKL